MRRSAIILGILGGVTGLGLWLLTALSCSCAVPPQYRTPIYPIDPSPLLSGPFGAVIILGAPLFAFIGIVAAVLVLIPRFQAWPLSRVEIICGLALAAFLGIISVSTQKPHDMGAFLLSLIGVIPGLLVVVSGLLIRKKPTLQTA